MYLARAGLELIGQVHSHPGRFVGHSDGDDERALMPYDGFLSIVVPHYGRRGHASTDGVRHSCIQPIRLSPARRLRHRGAVPSGGASRRSPKMTNFPTTANEFYALRDDRTNRCVPTRDYQRVHCAVSLSPQAASTVVGQTMLMVAANLLSRWCRRVTIALPDRSAQASLESGTGTLGDIVLGQMRDADPFGEFRVTRDELPAGEIQLRIGTNADAVSPSTVFINASGWLASVARTRPVELPSADEHNPLGR